MFWERYTVGCGEEGLPQEALKGWGGEEAEGPLLYRHSDCK